MIDSALQDDPEIRAALARRDIPTVYQRLVAAGVRQVQIAALTSQVSSEVSAIVHGRPVVAYEVLVRIADGLGIPRGWMGLAYDGETTREFFCADQPDQPEVTDAMKRRMLLAAASAAVFGQPVLGQVLALDHLPEATVLPTRIGNADVVALRAMTERFRALGRAGFGVPDVLSAVTERAEQLLIPYCSEAVRRALLSALAELHTLAGWWSHDALRIGRAWDHYNRAMELAGEADDVLGTVSAARHAAVIDCEGGAPNDALRLYQLAITKLADVRDYPELPADLAALHVRSARAWALLDRPEHAHRELQRAADLPPQSDRFEQADTDYTRALVQLALGRVVVAEQYATTALRTWPDADRRDSAKARIILAQTHTLTGEPDAPRLAVAALDAVDSLPSLRSRTLLAPLEKALAERKDSAYAELARRARELRRSG